MCLAVPSNASPERLAILRAHGVELHLTDPTEGTDGAREIVAQLAHDEPQRYFFADQYRNPANWQAHFRHHRSRDPEADAGRGDALRRRPGDDGHDDRCRPLPARQWPSRVRLVAVQPDGPIHGLEGLKHLPTAHVPEIYDPSVPDEIVTVDTEAAYAMARRLARSEGLLVGVSAAAAVDAALRVAERLDQGTVVVLLPDSGLKYLGGAFWSAAMTFAYPCRAAGRIWTHGAAGLPGGGRRIDARRASMARTGVVTHLLPLDNHFQPESRDRRYLITPRDLLRPRTRPSVLGLEIVGVFHSHPDHPARASEFDTQWALPVYSYLITQVQSGRAVEFDARWRLTEDRARM